MTHKGLLIALAVWLGSVGVVAGQLQHPTLLRNHSAIRYDSTQTNDPIARLNERLQIPVYDVQKVGYPQRMRDYDARRRIERERAARQELDDR